MSSDFDFDQFCRTLVRQAPDAMIYADHEGIIRFWNAGAERIFGFSEPEATGKSLDIIIPEDLRKRHWSGFHRTIRTGETRYGTGKTLEVRALHKDGRVISVEFSMLPFRKEDGTTLGIAVILRDVRARTGVRGAHADWMNL
jgi:PAS domain S-box-containing protein